MFKAFGLSRLKICVLPWQKSNKVLNINQRLNVSSSIVVKEDIKEEKEKPIIYNTKYNNLNNATTRYKTILYPTCASTSMVKWEVTPDPLPVSEKITGLILPYSHLSWLQVVVYPITLAAMYSLDFFSGYMPMWASILATTSLFRLITFKAYVEQRKIAVKTINIEPKMQEIRMRMDDAMLYGDEQDQSIAHSKLKQLQEENGLTAKARFMPIIFQAPFFVSLFSHLRNLSIAENEQFKTGGALWFSDLTKHDPYYVLPFFTSATLWLTMKMGASDTGASFPFQKYMMMIVPVVVFLFMFKYPAAVCLFWSMTNVFSLGSTLLMKNKRITKFLNIPELKMYDPKSLPLGRLSFKESFSQMMSKANAMKPQRDLKRLDELEFRKAGSGPMKKTYKIEKFK